METKPVEAKNWKEEFGEKFYRNEQRIWMSRSGESYGSEVPEMGQGELFRFIESLLEKEYDRGRKAYHDRATPILEEIARTEARKETIKEIRDNVNGLKLRMDNFSGDERERSKYNTALKDVVKFLDSLSPKSETKP